MRIKRTKEELTELVASIDTVLASSTDVNKNIVIKNHGLGIGTYYDFKKGTSAVLRQPGHPKVRKDSKPAPRKSSKETTISEITKLKISEEYKLVLIKYELGK